MYSMKKISIILTLLIALSVSVQAQFTSFGVRGGIGISKHVDDIADNPPIMGVNVGAFINYGFTNSQSLLAEHFYLQTGINVIRRGSKFQEILDQNMSIREGSYSGWYAQVPILASFKYELPVREPGHIALLSLGPAVSYGIIGKTKDRRVTRGLPQEDWNYDKTYDTFNAENGLNRFDVGFLFGVGYEHEDLSIMLQLDYGFLAVKQIPDALRNDQTEQTNNNIKYVPQGNNFGMLLTVGYTLSIR